MGESFAWETMRVNYTTPEILYKWVMETRGDRLAIILEELGLSAAGLARRLGVTKATVSKWGSDSIKDMKLDNLLKLEDELGYSMRWFISGHGPKRVIDILDISHIGDEAKSAVKATVCVLESQATYKANDG
jgi:transcriptional regulator with XRE-family HTH domain